MKLKFTMRLKTSRNQVSGESKKDNPVDVATVGYEAMMNGEGEVVAGFKNKVMSAAALFTPPETLAKQHRKSAEPGSANK